MNFVHTIAEAWTQAAYHALAEVEKVDQMSFVDGQDQDHRSHMLSEVERCSQVAKMVQRLEASSPAIQAKAA